MPILCFLIKAASVETSWLLIFACQSPKKADLALDTMGRWLEQLFHLSSIGRFLLLPSESGKCDKSLLPIAPEATVLYNLYRRPRASHSTNSEARTTDYK